MPSATTEGIRVTVESHYLEEHSEPEQNRFAFAYVVTIANEGAVRVQLRRRHWIITDGDGKVDEVRGPGVVGQQPILGPGQAFEYTSACPLQTPFGVMQGSYQMVTPAGDHFDIAIAPFSLHEPSAIN